MINLAEKTIDSTRPAVLQFSGSPEERATPTRRPITQGYIRFFVLLLFEEVISAYGN